ncbi:MAG TPA: sigma-54 dependent transcriptional regulator [Candidatus Eisenbacteria bacterium]|nr:sigma-54 dependent transcriptional regulator [Candidatus Eisenbacteria bacterium]
MAGRVLIVDDDKSMCETLAVALGKRDFEVRWTTAAAEALEILGASDVDVVLTDLNMRGMNGLELCERIVANRPDVPVIVITAFGSLETAVAAIRAGAYDFITKPPDTGALVVALERAIQHRQLREEVKRLRKVVEQSNRFETLLGSSSAMRAVYDVLDRIVDSVASVLVTGESGTGKEVVARALHDRGPRRDGPFVAINCSAMPEALLESELFGHVRGAFTDARTPRTGLCVQASGGTLLLDEIGDMPIALQPKLLRVLQERRVRPVGGDHEIPIDVRVIATTNRDLRSLIEEERFREDLYFRVNVIHVELPPLRARGGDVLVLAQHFVDLHAARAGKRVTGISPAAAEKLLAYAWPGNVRELQNCIERAIALTRYEEIAVEDLPEQVRAYKRSHVVVASDDPSEIVSLAEVERRYVLRVMEVTGGNKTLAAEKLGITRKTLYRKLQEYGAASGEDEP